MVQKPGEHAAGMVSREEYEQLKSRNAELEQQVSALTEALRLAQHKRFGASSEKTVDDSSQQLSFLFNEAEVISDHEAAQDKQETLVAAHKRHKKHEYTLDNLPVEERYKQRLEQAKPVLDELFRWVESVHYSPKAPWGSAMEYLKNQKAYLLNYLLDGRLEISNNRAERSIKPFVIDRKNFLFANTPGGARGSAVIFSLIQTAIENGLDPWRYLSWVIDMAAKGGVNAKGLFP